MYSKLNRLRTFAIVVTLFALIVLNQRYGSENTHDASQLAFAQWLTEAASKLQHPASVGAEKFNVSIDFNAGPSTQRLSLKANASDPALDSNQRVVRILELVRDSELVGQPDSQNKLEGASLSISDNTRTFNVVIDPEKINENSQAQLLLKLLQIYSSESTASPSTVQKKAE